MEIINSLNVKLNKHIEITRNGNPGGAGAARGGGGQYEGNSSMLHLETEMEKLRIDMQTQQNNERVR